MKFTPSPLYIEMARFYMQKKHQTNPYTGRRELPKIYNNGSSRSTKTYSAIQLIITFIDHNRKQPLYVGVFRDTLVDCRKYTYKDFVECIKMMDLYDLCSITEFPNPKIKLWGSTIEFMGLPEPNKQPPRTDICFFNEATEILDKTRVRGLLMRCEMLAIFDWNPSYSSHWVFDGENEFNVLFTRTTYLDNPFITENIISNIESYCPWDFADSHIEKRNGFNVRVWDKGESDRLPNQGNINANTADRWYWLVYGEGIPCARDGAVFPDVEWINEFPSTGMDEVILSMDFGYTCFSGSVLIKTKTFEKRIEDIVAGELVLTDDGYRKVLKVHRNGFKRVIEKKLVFDFGYKKIICTSDHKFKTSKGWKQLKDLQKGDELFLSASLTDKNITDTHTENIKTIFSAKAAKKGFTGRYGNILMGKFRNTYISIILMVIRLITTLKIFVCLQEVNIQNYMGILQLARQRMGTLKKIGTAEEKRSLNLFLKQKGTVKIAGKLLHLQMPIKSAALQNVIIGFNILMLNIAKHIFAGIAQVLLSVIDILKGKRVPENVCTSWVELKDVETIAEFFDYVYDLEVEWVHNYFANGILAHNCDNTTLERTGRIGKDRAIIECMACQPTSTPEICYALIKPQLMRELQRRKDEGISEDELWICCESQDRFGTELFVQSLNEMAAADGMNWNFFKIAKNSILAGVSIMHRFKLTLVHHPRFEIEQQNYIYQMINGQATNLPDPNSKFCDIWDGARYGFQNYFYGIINK